MQLILELFISVVIMLVVLGASLHRVSPMAGVGRARGLLNTSEGKKTLILLIQNKAGKLTSASSSASHSVIWSLAAVIELKESSHFPHLNCNNENIRLFPRRKVLYQPCIATHLVPWHFNTHILHITPITPTGLLCARVPWF